MKKNILAQWAKPMSNLGYAVICMTLISSSWAKESPLKTVDKVELDQYLGVWYEIARKPNSLENQCVRDVSFSYTLSEYGNMLIEQRCYDQQDQLVQNFGEAYASNAPWYNKFRVSYLPDGIRWLPIGKNQYWILKLDQDYKMALIGDPERQYLWLLSREPHPDAQSIKAYLDYAQAQGYQLNNLIYSPHGQN
ncbi:apolipoprotein D and lipocalin family protein [Acinetobacter calcoaceticus]|uniref:Outer membrane lipoprotein Blc n=1 Tax=Acinetobacter calcoaceticus TaxID=471 RepID=A0A4R1XUW5_ACICA|nr:apolipoprotein D and lipocalin family protein [Acinetobacter calcoaceticus]